VCVCGQEAERCVRVKLLGVVFARTYRVCVVLFVYGSDFDRERARVRHEPHSIQSNGVADDRLLLRHCRSFGLGESPRGSCVALVCAVWTGRE